MPLTRDDIVDGLSDLASRISELDLALEINVVGGAAIVLEHNADRGSTQDVDSWIHASPITRAEVDDVVVAIARERDWPNDWLNDKANVFIPEDADSADWTEFFAVGSVTVNVASAEMLFVMKLRAGRPARDFADLDVLADHLGLRSRQEAIDLYDSRYDELPLKPRAQQWLDRRFGEPANATSN